MDKNGIWCVQISYLLLIRLIPIIPFAVANIAPALFDVSLKRFFVTTYLGIIPGGFVFTWLGVGLSEIFANILKVSHLKLYYEHYLLLLKHLGSQAIAFDQMLKEPDL